VHLGSTSRVSAFFVARCKADALVHYFFKFATSPGERCLAALAAPFLYAIILAGGAIASLRRKLTPQ
jgi:hypothetical protein